MEQIIRAGTEVSYGNAANSGSISVGPTCGPPMTATELNDKMREFYDELARVPLPRLPWYKRFTFEPWYKILARFTVLAIAGVGGWGFCAMIENTPWPSQWETAVCMLWGAFIMWGVFLIMGDRRL